MESFLIITNADMSLQSGDVVLITRRAEEFYKEFKIKTICLLLRNDIKVKHNIEAIEYVNIEDKNPIRDYILMYKPKNIIFYGIRSYKYIGYTKRLIESSKLDIKILIDIQGALEEGIEYKKGLKLIRSYSKYIVKRRIFKKAINNSNGAFVVSDELKQYCYSYLNNRSNEDFIIHKIRCGINEVITREQKLRWRNDIRGEWGIDNETVVMAFSGYRMPWQNFDVIVEKFKEYDKKMDKVFFAFFCNIDEEVKKQLREAFPKKNYVLKFLNFEEYFKHLCACDVGFLIRDHNVTNKVAFPNKFSDYINAGLMVAINSALPEPFRLLQNSGCNYIDLEKDSIEKSTEKIIERQNNLDSFYFKTEKLCNTELTYSAQVKSLNI